MYTVVVTIHVIICIALVVLVLMSQGKGAEAGVAFGSGSSGSLFGSGGSDSFMVKVTTVMAIAFFATSLTLCLMKFDDTHQLIDRQLSEQKPS